MQVRLRRRELDAVRASAIAGSISRRHGSDAVALCAASSPATGPGTAQEPGPTRKTCDDEPSKSMSIDSMCGSAAAVRARPGQRDEEVEQAVGSVPGAVHEQEAAAAGAGQRALGDPGGERGREARVDGVAALGEDLGARLGGQPVPGGDRPSHRREGSAGADALYRGGRRRTGERPSGARLLPPWSVRIS